MHISGKGKRKNKKVKGFSVTDNGFFILLQIIRPDVQIYLYIFYICRLIIDMYEKIFTT